MTASFPSPSGLHTASFSVSAVRVGVIALACGSAMACSLILKPNDDVERCGTADDCSPTGDSRYVPLCKFDAENTDLDSTKVEKICVADFKSIGCDPENEGGASLVNGFQDAFGDDACVQLGCADENLGKVGCKAPSGGSCDSGLELDEDGYCIDPNADEPVIPAGTLAGNDLTGQHVKDQWCKSFFCDDTFVCNESLKCQPCDPDAEYGQGGCGLVYAEGAPAKIYVLGSDLTNACGGEEVSTEDPGVFGECS